MLYLSNVVAPAILDGIAIFIIIIFVIIGIKQGFVKTFFSTFGGFLALLIAILLCSPTTSFLESKFGAVGTVSKGLSGVLTNIFGDGLMNTTLSSATESGMAQSGLAGWILNYVLSLKGASTIPTDTTLNQIICPVFGFYVVMICCAIVLYIIFRIIFFLVSELVAKLHSFRVVGSVDKILGALFGILRAILMIDLIILIITAIPLGFFQSIVTQFDQTFLVKIIRDTNLYNIIIQSLLNNNIIEVIKGAFLLNK